MNKLKLKAYYYKYKHKYIRNNILVNNRFINTLRILYRFIGLTKFNNCDEIPEPPIINKYLYKWIIVPIYIKCGAIPKDKLINGIMYEGSCRNTSKAIWKGDHFEYDRYKWGTHYTDEINHFQDDDGHDVFVPIKLITY